MYCSKCGAKSATDDAMFCQHCGSSMGRAVPPDARTSQVVEKLWASPAEPSRNRRPPKRSKWLIGSALGVVGIIVLAGGVFIAQSFWGAGNLEQGAGSPSKQAPVPIPAAQEPEQQRPATGAQQPASTRYSIQYLGDGHPTYVDVILGTDKGSVQADNFLASAIEKQVTLQSGDVAYMSLTISSSGGWAECSIYVDGNLEAQSSAEGAGNTAICEVPLP